MRFSRGTWTAGNHVFNYQMRCSHCGVTYKQHNLTASQAMTITDRAQKEQRSLSDAEQALMNRLRPERCNYALDKLRREKILRERNARRRKRK